MADTPEGLLYVLSHSLPNVPTDEFNDFYDNQIIPARLSIASVTTATRYHATDKESPEWLMLGTLANFNDLDEINKKSDASVSNPLVARLPILQRRTYTFISQLIRQEKHLKPNALPTKFMVAVLWQIPDEHGEKFHKWYHEDHLDNISRTHGWLRVRQFKLLDAADMKGKGPSFEGKNYLVLHDYETGGAHEAPDVISACETPWSKRDHGHGQGHGHSDLKLGNLVIRQYELHRHWVKDA